MEREIVRELTDFEKDLAKRWQVYPEVIVKWVDELELPADDDEAAVWFSKHIDFILEEQKRFFEDSLFPRPLRPESSETAA